MERTPTLVGRLGGGLSIERIGGGGRCSDAASLTPLAKHNTINLEHRVRKKKMARPKRSEPFTRAASRLRRLFYEGVWRRRNRIRQVVVVGFHRDDLGRRLRTGRLLRRNRGHSQNDAAMNRIDLENSEIEVHRLVDDVRRTAHRLSEIELAHWNEAFDVVADIDDHALVHQSHDLAVQL